MSQAEHSPILRRAVLRAQPEFHDWDEQRQLQYRIHMPEAERFILERSVFHDLYGVDCASEEALREAWDELPLGELDAINRTLLPWQGIGEDSFYFNEAMPDADRLRFDTLDDYARADHAFQEAARRKDDPEHVIRSYQGNLYGCWARLFVDDEFQYANLDSLAGHLGMSISEQIFDLLDTLIPHRYVPGPDDGKWQGNGYIWDKRVDADGLESQFDELKNRLFRYEQQRWRELYCEFDERADTKTWLQEFSNGVDEQLIFVFSDKSAMAQVRLRHFVRDFRRLKCDNSELTHFEQREAEFVDTFARQQYADIMHEP